MPPSRFVIKVNNNLIKRQQKPPQLQKRNTEMRRKKIENRVSYAQLIPASAEEC